MLKKSRNSNDNNNKQECWNYINNNYYSRMVEFRKEELNGEKIIKPYRDVKQYKK